MTPSTQKKVTPLIQGRWVIMVCGKVRGRRKGKEERRRREGKEESREGGEKAEGGEGTGND